jgi:two-component system OmpR family sensor kinase
VSPPRWLRRHSLLWRIMLFGLLLLVAVVVATIVTTHLTGGPGPGRLGVRIAHLAQLQLQPLAADRVRLNQELDRLHRELGVDFAVYEVDGTLVASSGQAPAPLGNNAIARLDASPIVHHHRTWMLATWLEPQSIYLLARDPDHPSAVYLVPYLLAVLAALALVSIPLARSIARPIAQIAATAGRLAAGDLTARTGIRGGGEVGELAKNLDEMAGRLEAMRKTERELLANISHELRTPLARMGVALDLFADRGSPPGAKDLADLSRDLREIERLVSDVLLTARLDIGTALDAATLPLNRERVLPTALAEDARSAVRALYPEADIRIGGDTSCAVEADAVLLRRLVENLLLNAVVHGAPPVELAIVRVNDGAQIEVSDRGSGIAAEDLAHVFEPFFRGKNAGAKPGSGLGLALCRRIALAHRGTILAMPRNGGGTTLRVFLPDRLQA